MGKEVHVPEWQKKDFTNFDFRTELERGTYDNGIAIVLGPTLTGKNGKYLNAADCDHKAGVGLLFENWEAVISYSKKALVEWHNNPDSLHVPFYTDEPIQKVIIKTEGGQLEIRGEHQLLFVSPSIHKDGNSWKALGTRTIPRLTHREVLRFESKIDVLSGQYMSTDRKAEYIKWLEDPANYSKLGEGEGRHEALKTMGCSFFYRYLNGWRDLTDEQRKERLWNYNLGFAVPKSESEFNHIWDWVVQRHTLNRDRERSRREEWEQKEKEAREKSNSIFSPNSNFSDANTGPKPMLERIIDELLKIHSFATLRKSETIYNYKDGKFVDEGDSVIRETLENLYGCKLRIRHRAEIKEHIKSKTFHNLSDFDSDVNVINMKNGLYDIRTGELKPHTPEYLSINQIPVIYDPNAKSKLFGKFLSEVLYPEEIRTLVELMAYTFYRDNPHEIITILLGGGSNGKGIIFALLTGLHGDDNVSTVSLKAILERPFALYDFVGKACNLDAELSSGEITDTAILKKMTGRQKIRVEQKNKPAFDARLYAKPWLSANELPQSADKTYAWFRRNYVIATPHTFEGKNDDVDLRFKITTPEELSGIFNTLMMALRRILSRKEIFVNEKTIEQRMVRYEGAVDPVGSFLNELVPEDVLPSDKMTKSVAYAAFKEYCKTKRFPVMQKDKFGASMHRHGKHGESVKVEGKTYRVWLSMKLPEEYYKKLLIVEALRETYPDGHQKKFEFESEPEQEVK